MRLFIDSMIVVNLRRDFSQRTGKILSAIALVSWIDGGHHKEQWTVRKKAPPRLLKVVRVAVNIIRTQDDEILCDLIGGTRDRVGQTQLTFLKSKVNLDAKVTGGHKVAHHLATIACDHNYL